MRRCCCCLNFLFQCAKLKELGVKCLFISDSDGRGAMDVFGHPRAVQFAQDSQMAAKFFAFVNGEGSLGLFFVSRSELQVVVLQISKISNLHCLILNS